VYTCQRNPPTESRNKSAKAVNFFPLIEEGFQEDISLQLLIAVVIQTKVNLSEEQNLKGDL
jgi:hypothetical protein